MPVEERSLTSRGVRKRGKAWLLARAYQSHYVSETPARITRASVISSVSRMREIRTSGLMSGGLETQSREPNCRHGAKATERPPDPKAGAPAPDSTCTYPRRNRLSRYTDIQLVYICTGWYTPTGKRVSS